MAKIEIAAIFLIVFETTLLHSGSIKEENGMGYVIAMITVLVPAEIIGTPICVDVIVDALIGLNR